MPKPNSDSSARRGGPVTEAGKRRSSLNAQRHGLLSSALVLHNEDPAHFDHFRRMYLETFQPVGFLELELLDEMVAARWRQRRLWTLETAAVDYEMDIQREESPEDVDHLDQPTRTARAIKVLTAESSELQNYNRYESRFHRMYHRALNTLLELQDRRKRDGQPVGNTELSDPLPEPASNLPNELPERPAYPPAAARIAYPTITETIEHIVAAAVEASVNEQLPKRAAPATVAHRWAA